MHKLVRKIKGSFNLIKTAKIRAFNLTYSNIVGALSGRDSQWARQSALSRAIMSHQNVQKEPCKCVRMLVPCLVTRSIP
jgi:hypothetical protein